MLFWRTRRPNFARRPPTVCLCSPRTVPLATVSYVLAAAELVEDMRRIGVEPAAVYVASSGSTGAGWCSVCALGIRWPVRSIGYIRWSWDVPPAMAEWANGGAEHLGLPHRLSGKDIDYTTEQIGIDYGQMTVAGREALRIMAETEALLLDPVYTAARRHS